MAKMWAGRFGKETDRLVDDFNTSLPFDCRLYREEPETWKKLQEQAMAADFSWRASALSYRKLYRSLFA